MIADPALSQIAETQVVATGVAPGASLALAERRSGAWRIRLGSAGFLDHATKRAVCPETPYDLASVTKPVLALTLARLDAAGALSLADPLGRHLPEVRGTESAELPLELFLAHRAGLEAHRPLFAPLLSGAPFSRAAALREASRARRPEAAGAAPSAGFPPVYSDLGYLLLGAAVERAVGRPLDALIQAEVAAPLGLWLGSARQALAQVPDFCARVAPTEIVPWRGGLISGVVHDENAWALSGHACSGHAGLFGTAEAVARFGAAMLDLLAGRAPSLLPATTADLLVRERPGSSLRAGFDGVSGPGSAAGTKLGPRTFGHLGFTGTSLWCDPDAEIVTALLTNRVHPTREHVEIRRARPRVQDALFGLTGIGASTGLPQAPG
ncbi:MAG: esterase [Polyangiaceae bacterium]